MPKTTTTPLKGKALLDKIKQLSDLPRRETAKRCGYYGQTKNGEIRVNLTDFYDAVLAAQGLELEPGKNRETRGRDLTYRATVHTNGQIVIGASYTEAMGLQPGDEFEIKLGSKHIHLTMVEN